jgi:hypothetical protein
LGVQFRFSEAPILASVLLSVAPELFPFRGPSVVPQTSHCVIGTGSIIFSHAGLIYHI